MNKYRIEIHETMSKIITVSAENEDDAIDGVQEAYSNGDYVLDYTDFSDVEFNLLGLV